MSSNAYVALFTAVLAMLAGANFWFWHRRSVTFAKIAGEMGLESAPRTRHLDLLGLGALERLPPFNAKRLDLQRVFTGHTGHGFETWLFDLLISNHGSRPHLEGTWVVLYKQDASWPCIILATSLFNKLIPRDVPAAIADELRQRAQHLVVAAKGPWLAVRHRHRWGLPPASTLPQLLEDAHSLASLLSS